MGLLFAFLISIIIVAVCAPMLSKPLEVYAHPKDQDDEHGHHAHH